MSGEGSRVGSGRVGEGIIDDDSIVRCTFSQTDIGGDRFSWVEFVRDLLSPLGIPVHRHVTFYPRDFKWKGIVIDDGMKYTDIIETSPEHCGNQPQLVYLTNTLVRAAAFLTLRLSW